MYVKFCDLVLLIPEKNREGVWGRELHSRPHAKSAEQSFVFFTQNEFCGRRRENKFRFVLRSEAFSLGSLFGSPRFIFPSL